MLGDSYWPTAWFCVQPTKLPRMAGNFYFWPRNRPDEDRSERGARLRYHRVVNTYECYFQQASLGERIPTHFVCSIRVGARSSVFLKADMRMANKFSESGSSVCCGRYVVLT